MLQDIQALIKLLRYKKGTAELSRVNPTSLPNESSTTRAFQIALQN